MYGGQESRSDKRGIFCLSFLFLRRGGVFQFDMGWD